MAFSTTVGLTELRTALDASRAACTANKRLGQEDAEIPLRLASLAAGDHLLTRSIAWTQLDDQELRTMFIRVTDGTAGRSVRASLTVDDGETQFLVDKTCAVSLTTVMNGTVDARADFRTVTGTRVRLLRGVRYRLDIEVLTAAATVTGPLLAGVQLRSLRRGGAGGPMLVPNAFRAHGNFDSQKLNEDLQAYADNIQDSMDARYTYSRAFFDLAGLTDTFAAVRRQFAIRRPLSGAAVEIAGVELVASSSTTGATWTLSKVGDATWPTISIDGAGANIEAYASTSIGAQVASNSADTVFQLDANTATGKTITAGYLVVHFRCDRWNQGTGIAPYVPSLFDATTPTDAATLQAEIDAIASAVAADAAATQDLRCSVFVVHGLAAGSSVAWRTQGGATNKDFKAELYVVAAATETATLSVNDGGGAHSVNLVGGGVAARVRAGLTLGETGGSDPLVAAQDTTITISNAGAATLLLAYAVVWWR